MLTFIEQGVNILIVLTEEHKKQQTKFKEKSHKKLPNKKIKNVLTTSKRDAIMSKALKDRQNLRTQTFESTA